MDDPIVCSCMDIRKSQIVKAIQDNKLSLVSEVQTATQAGTICSACVDEIQNIINQIKK